MGDTNEFPGWTQSRNFATHWVCFECKKMFRKPVSKSARTCPQCRKPMIDMGRYFEPPRMAEIKLWQALKELADAGVRFTSASTRFWFFRGKCGRKGPSSRSTLSRIRATLERLRIARESR